MMIKILSGASLALGGYIAAMNWYSIYASYRSHRNVSPVPLVGAFFLVLGLLGFPETKPYAWAGVLADYGTVALILAIPALVRDSWTTSRFNLLHRFLSDAKGRRDDIRLFKGGRFTIKTDFDPPIRSDEHGALAVSQGRVGTWRKDGECFCLEGYGENKLMRIKARGDRFIVEEEGYPGSNEFQYNHMGGLTLKQLK
jgi:hypothetical protein